MKFDMRLITGILVGMVIGLHYVDQLLVYVPLLSIVALILVLKTIRH